MARQVFHQRPQGSRQVFGPASNDASPPAPPSPPILVPGMVAGDELVWGDRLSMLFIWPALSALDAPESAADDGVSFAPLFAVEVSDDVVDGGATLVAIYDVQNTEPAFDAGVAVLQMYGASAVEGASDGGGILPMLAFSATPEAALDDGPSFAFFAAATSTLS